jgi:hypothetical protein
MRAYYRRFKEKHGVSSTTKWRREHPDAAEVHRDREKQRWYSNPAMKIRHARYGKAERDRLRNEVFAAYGGAICACCDETERKFLSIDHVKNNGAAQRRELGYSGMGSQFYRWLKKHGFPPGYQILCMNCNFGKHMNDGVCPHAARREE